MTAWAENCLGLAASNLGDYPGSCNHHLESLRLARLLGDHRPTALALEGFAVLYARHGDTATGLAIAAAASALRQRIGVPRHLPESDILASALDMAPGELPTAEAEHARLHGRPLSVDDAVNLARDAYGDSE